MNEETNPFLQGMAEAEQRHTSGGMHPVLVEYEAIQRRGAVEVSNYVPPAENPMKPEPKYPPASAQVHYKRILIAVGLGFAVYSVWAFVAANAVLVGGVVVGAVLLSAMFGGSSGKPSGGHDFGGHGANGGNAQNINITINAPNGGNVNFEKK